MPTPNDFSKDNTGPDQQQNPRQMSSKEGDPNALFDSVKKEVDDNYEMLETYGIECPVATLGSHPWLRDSQYKIPQPNGKRGIPEQREAGEGD